MILTTYKKDFFDTLKYYLSIFCLLNSYNLFYKKFFKGFGLQSLKIYLHLFLKILKNRYKI